jgi:hypothetical protein
MRHFISTMNNLISGSSGVKTSAIARGRSAQNARGTALVAPSARLRTRRHFVLAAMIAAIAFLAFSSRSFANPSPQKKDYLSDAEADKIRDADTPSERMKLFISFADDRIKKIQYELNRTAPERNRTEILNGLMNGYAGCIDDAADQIDVAQEKQQDIHDALKVMLSKGKEFLDILNKIDKDGPDLDTYRDTLEDAIEGTKDALSDAQDAGKAMPPPAVRRKPS